MLCSLLTHPEVFGHEPIDEGVDATRREILANRKFTSKITITQKLDEVGPFDNRLSAD